MSELPGRPAVALATSASPGADVLLRPIRGSCSCGRNRFIVTLPTDGIHQAQVLFNTDRVHQVPLGTPLAAYLRVPLSWYHSTTFAQFPDETHAMIRRVYTPPNQGSPMRHFCGFCGTPLSYWCENPISEASYINLTLGSLLQDDLRDLEDMGLLPDDRSDSEQEAQGGEGEEGPASPGLRLAMRESYGVPWFDGLVEGTRLGRMRRTQGIRSSGDGRVRVEWEIVEFDGDDEDGNEGQEMDVDTAPAAGGKRKRESTDAASSLK
ncbi:unnamed protein product [Clonostachys rosea f. rosea IK726]|uniref:Uncharacterized protein n=1 Tax=Clonostachys rosea f. rosea IK726 TaxID=1349383 RepID=A0ACA9T9S2_BIOOC|nr:unnamed protein product [Clonostachys rosea f. rosea IK726]